MTQAVKEVVDKYNQLSDKEKCEFLKSMDKMGGCETYSVGSQIDEFIEFVESSSDNDNEA